MLSADTLIQKLESIDGKDYAAYQGLLGRYDFSLFRLIIQQIPKDPYAPPHTGVYRIIVKRNDKRIINLKLGSKIRKIAFADFLARKFYGVSNGISASMRGTGYSGMITINQPGQAILERNSVIISDDEIEVRCFIGLPAEGRSIIAETAETMLLEELPQIVNNSLLAESIDPGLLQLHIETAEDAEYLREQLVAQGLVAFIADGALLPRRSGTSDEPLSESTVVPFVAPDSLAKEIDLPHAKRIRGMGIPQGVTLITGGGYHGKSTLLDAIEVGIYNHLPGDGRERCVSNFQAVKVRAYSGRYIAKTDISPFINNLPFDQDTSAFFTENASGSTSQAANIVEAIEAGAEALLMDEDTCATNFMIRDSKMQQLVNKQDEPITTYIDVARQLYRERKISTVLVLGGVGDYFEISDHVIQMINYKAFDVTTEAHKIAYGAPVKRKAEGDISSFEIHDRIPMPESINPLNEYGIFRIYAKDANRLNFGAQKVDLADLEQLVELSQTKALGYAMEYAKKYMDRNTTLREVVRHVEKDIEEYGLDVISDKISGHFARFRALELAFAFNRLRGFDVAQKKN